jgi:hypothetical protein
VQDAIDKAEDSEKGFKCTNPLSCAQWRLQDFDSNEPGQVGSYEGDYGEVTSSIKGIVISVRGVNSARVNLNNLKAKFEAQYDAAKDQMGMLETEVCVELS